MSFGKIIGKEGSNKENSDADSKSPSDYQKQPTYFDKTRSEAILGKGSRVVGTLTFTGPVEIGGYVEGEIQAQDKILITESAEINAKIVGAEVTVQGTVTGDIQASKKLVLKRPAKIFGNISCNNLSIEEGVTFEGKCNMASPDSSNKTSSQPKTVPNNKVAGSI